MTLVAPGTATTPEHYVSEISGEPIHVDDLTDCDRCDSTGEVALVWRDAWTKRLVEEVETCPDCGGLGLLEGYGVRGDNNVPRRVRPLTGPKPAA